MGLAVLNKRHLQQCPSLENVKFLCPGNHLVRTAVVSSLDCTAMQILNVVASALCGSKRRQWEVVHFWCYPCYHVFAGIGSLLCCEKELLSLLIFKVMLILCCFISSMPWLILRLAGVKGDVIHLHEHLIFAVFINSSAICKKSRSCEQFAHVPQYATIHLPFHSWIKSCSGTIAHQDLKNNFYSQKSAQFALPVLLFFFFLFLVLPCSHWCFKMGFICEQY